VLQEEWLSSRILGDRRVWIAQDAWYDNEMGFSTSLAKTAARIAG